MGREFDAMAACAPYARTGYWPPIVLRVHCGDRVVADPVVMTFGHAAHDRQLFQEMADGMGGCSGLRVSRWRQASHVDVSER